MNKQNESNFKEYFKELNRRTNWWLVFIGSLLYISSSMADEPEMRAAAWVVFVLGLFWSK